jgi:hypothetical protein
MKITLVMLSILGASLIGIAQDKNFDLSKYKFPDYKRHELELNFNSSGNSHSYYTVFPSTINYSETKFDRSNSNFNSYFKLGYNYENLTRKRIDHFYSSFTGQYDYSKSNDSGNLIKQSEPALNWNFNGFKRYYQTEDKVFFEGLTDFQYNYNYRKSTNDVGTVSIDVSKSRNLTLSVGMGVGIGRIEHVNDLWQGYYILEKLKQQNSFDRELQEKDIFEFAQLISKLKNKRFFDARIRKIAELQALDSMMHQQGLINKSDISYFTTLNDYWSFPISFDRKSGRELKFQLLPEITNEYYKSNNNAVDSPTRANLVSKIQFDSSKQINLFWERTAHIDVINTTLLAKNGDVPNSYPGNFVGTNASFGFGFYPDSRTRLGLSGQYSGYESPYFEGENVMKYWNSNIKLTFAANYFISPQLQITGNFSGNYWFTKHNSFHEHNTNFNLGFRYAIF